MMKMEKMEAMRLKMGNKNSPQYEKWNVTPQIVG
jgi:hypothetical protein